MAAVTLANIPIFVIQLMVFGFQSGGSVLISQHWGKKDTDTINRVIGISFYFAGALSLLFALVMVIFPRLFMGLFSNNAQLVEIAVQYARIVGPSYVFNSITQVYLGAQRSMENPRLGSGGAGPVHVQQHAAELHAHLRQTRRPRPGCGGRCGGHPGLPHPGVRGDLHLRRCQPPVPSQNEPGPPPGKRGGPAVPPLCLAGGAQ